MDTNKIIETKGIVLRSTRYKESSRIIDLFTNSRGRVNIFVSGALRPNNSLMLVTEKYVESDFQLELNKNNYYIKSGQIRNSNLDLGKNPENFLVGEIISEVILLTMPENLVDETIYDLTIKTFEILRSNTVTPSLIRIGFLIKYISLLGFKPNLSSCTHCGTKKIRGLYFSNEIGGILCEKCLESIQDYGKLNKSDLEFMLFLLYKKYEDYKGLDINKDQMIRIENIIYNYFLYNTELIELESRKKYFKLFGI